MPAPYSPQEFREDVVRVARSRKGGITIAQTARDFGVHEMTRHKWIRQAEIDDGSRPGIIPPPGELAGNRIYPLVCELDADGIPVAVSLRVLKLSPGPTTAGGASRSPSPS